MMSNNKLEDKMKNLSNKIKWIVLLFACAYIISCNEDKGNYDYIVVNEVSIKDIPNQIASIGEKLIVKPEIAFVQGTDTVTLSQNESEDMFIYTWYRYAGSASGWQSFAEGRYLELEIDGVFGKPTEGAPHRLAYEVKNKKTQIAYRKLFNLSVISPLERGYVALCEKEGGFDIDLIAYVSNKFVQYSNILNRTGSDLPRDGITPVDILTFPDEMAPDPYNRSGAEYSVYILTHQYTTRIKAADYSWLPSYDLSNSIEKNSYLDKEYLQKGKSVIAQQMKTAFRVVNNSVYVRTFIYHKEDNGAGNWYVSTRNPAWYFYSAQMNRMRPAGDSRYEPAPFIAVGQAAAMYYDTNSKVFKVGTVPTTAGDLGTTNLFYTQPLGEEPAGGQFNFNAPNNGLLYMGERLSAGYTTSSYAILKQTDGSYKYIEFDLTSNTISSITAVTNKKRACVFPAGSKIGNAKFFASAPYNNSPWLFYVTTDNKVYRADISGGTAVESDITSTILKGDGYDEITTFKYLLPQTGDYAEPVRLSLAVGTYNMSKGKNEGGKLEFFLMNDQTSGTLTLAKYPAEPAEDGYQIDMSWTGLGRIVGLSFKQQ
jgi:hypothetical protein